MSQRKRLVATWQRAVRAVAGSGYQEDVAPLLKELMIDPIEHRCAQHVAVTTFRCRHGTAPPDLRKKLKSVDHGRTTRGASGNYVPYCSSSTSGTVSFSNCAPLIIKNIHTTCARKIGILRRLRKKLHPSIFKKFYVGVIRLKLAGVWMRNMERGLNFKVAELTKNILSTASHFPSSSTETIRLLYTYIIFQNTHAWSPKISAQHPARPYISLWVQFSQEFLPGAYSKSDIYSYFLLSTSNNFVEWFTSWLTITHHKQQFWKCTQKIPKTYLTLSPFLVEHVPSVIIPLWYFFLSCPPPPPPCRNVAG